VALPPEKRFAPKTEFQIPVLPTIAHRGFSQKFPENTLAAFRGAIATSADGCEFDVRKTRDDKLIILHDATLARTTKAPAAGTAAGAQKTKINALTYAEISVFDAGACKGAEFAGERVPTLDDALALLAASNCRPVVEIKVENIEAEVIAALKKAKLFDKAVVITFSKTVVKKLRALEPRLPVAWLCGTPKGDVIRAADIFTRQAREIGTNLLDIEHSRLTEPLVAELRRRGFTVWAWTVDKPERAALLRKWGVSAITTNRPDAIATAK
jgi:glycerophosphoryl diester phosphodiesterase